MSPQRDALRSLGRREGAKATVLPRQLAGHRRSTAARGCEQCGALVVDAGRHRDWHESATSSS